MKSAIAIHGGAGTILKSSMTPELEISYHQQLKLALEAGNQILNSGGTAEDAVTAAVVVMEDSELFNAGKGSVFNSEGQHEMDASIMTGQNLEAGAAAGVSGVKNPIILAKEILNRSSHVMLGGTGAEEFARNHGIEFRELDYFHSEYRYQQFLTVKDTDKTQLDHTPEKGKIDKYGTVGAVALDTQGNIAAATSTGGMTNKRYGRIGDSPLIGAGNYANNKTCAVSCTGDGEFFIRGMVAYDISCLMEYKGLSLEAASDLVIHEKMVKLGGEGGVIAIDANGNIALPFNTAGMYRGQIDLHGNLQTSIYKD